MKALYTLLASALISQAAAAAEISCNITRANLYDDRDVATHAGSLHFDSSLRRDGVIAEGEIYSHLLPDSGRYTVRFQLLDRRSLSTELSLEIYSLRPYQYVAGDTQIGSLSGAPGTVTSSFVISGSPYTVEISCDVNN